MELVRSGLRGFALLALFVAGTAVAQAQVGAPQQDSSALRALTQADEARVWRAVGRLDFPDGTCTGTLVSRRHVVTAAHCVLNPETGALRPAETVVFRAGLRNGIAYASHRAKRIETHPDYNASDTDRLRQIGSDIALIELHNPIQDQTVQPLARQETPVTGQEVMVVSYGEGRNESASLQQMCRLLESYGSALLYDCSATFGSSGSPVLVASLNGPRLVSILAAKGTWGEQDVTAAAALGGNLDFLLQRLQQEDPRVKRVTPEIRPLNAQLGRKTSSGLPQIKP